MSAVAKAVDKREPGGTPTQREEIARLRAENASLRRQLGAATPMDLDSWEIIPQDLRDHLAVRVFHEEYGHFDNALKRMGFKYNTTGKMKDSTPEDRAYRKHLIDRVFNTPGAQALFARNLKQIEQNWEDALARQMNIALNGKDESSVRAFQTLARVTGKLKEDIVPPATTIHLFGLVGGAVAAREPHRVRTIEHDPALESKDPLVLLGHDPGSAQRIDSGDERVYKALETSAEPEPELDDLNESEESVPEREGAEPAPVLDDLGIDG